LAEALEIYKQLSAAKTRVNPIYKQKIQDIEVQLNPVSQTIETKEIDPGYFKPESTIPEFRRVEVTDEKAIQPYSEVVLHEPFQPERNHSHSITAPEVEIEDFVDTLVKKILLEKQDKKSLNGCFYWCKHIVEVEPVFNMELNTVLSFLDGAKAILIMGYDGIVVESASKDQDEHFQDLTIELGQIVKTIGELSKNSNVGQFSEMVLQFDQAKVLLRSIHRIIFWLCFSPKKKTSARVSLPFSVFFQTL
jgi:predicted regulator of Ras-like GTPase activity (Roadblock/LC7/MglB family)